jgi:arylsulfatase A-like enzyme
VIAAIILTLVGIDRPASLPRPGWRGDDDLPERWHHAFQGQKDYSCERDYRFPMLIRWSGHIKASVTTDQMMAALDWMPTLTELAGGPTGDRLKK